MSDGFEAKFARGIYHFFFFYLAYPYLNEIAHVKT